MLRSGLRSLVLGSVLSAAAALSAHAGPAYNVQDYSGSGYFGPDNLYSQISITVDNNTLSVLAGQFHLERAPVGSSAFQDFLTFCLQPNVWLAPFDNPYYQDSFATAAGAKYNTAVGLTTVGDMIKDLWALFRNDMYSGTASEQDIKAAAFQVAIWELSYDAGSKDLSGGGFKMSAGNATQNAVIAQALAYLSPVDGLGPLANIEVLWDNNAGPDRQDLIVDAPEPATLGLMGLALFGLGAAARRRRRRA